MGSKRRHFDIYKHLTHEDSACERKMYLLCASKLRVFTIHAVRLYITGPIPRPTLPPIRKNLNQVYPRELHNMYDCILEGRTVENSLYLR